MITINTYALQKRRTFAIISHPDAGKTTLTEKFLLNGKIIRTSGTIKARRSKKYAKSDWMEIEKKKGISITTSVIQIPYNRYLINILDTPGHQDFSEDTYRVLTAVDFCVMIVDAAKGVEERTRKLIHVARTHRTPIITFINKLDRNSLDPIEILDQLEIELKIKCSPIIWPISCGKAFKGIYHIYNNLVYFYSYKTSEGINDTNNFLLKTCCLNDVFLDKIIGLELAQEFREEVELVNSIYKAFNKRIFLESDLTPIFFGSALKNFGVNFLMQGILDWAPSPVFKKSNIRKVQPYEKNFSGFVFKIQANMDLRHRDRMAFIRIVSGKYRKRMKLYHVRIKKYIIQTEVFSFVAGDRFIIETAYPGDIIGFHSYNSIKIGDTFTEGEKLKFFGIPNFAPELFRLVSLVDPFHKKKLLKGLTQLSEEGAIQVFKPYENNELILGAIGSLQFDIVIERLKIEYNIFILVHKVNIFSIRWISSNSLDTLSTFKNQNKSCLALDINNHLVYLASSEINLRLVQSRYPDIIFNVTCEN
ncbi:peptide chain release factor 3 [Buchnera aphidicola str. Bp (Baizongia pistaciae)]|uniref:Peptide chain release factor 3 n=1 Tax=Buchnera aphidicola subsp. Baizongia pistaciae (strain Bp) TaxID=224915 RepID=RF3_BUCBP|nr:peptide chain release factor 3 [Buchnera aphidicola]Q89A56.1 RecName: Full=Peptide chain release factor 3; Short=RF-3 [Buchnera aphidicola str. Bp (Baizongia pistaciae)]AAO27190.1 peptide chain release factor 3 [Buchnera aphidicola str. Bp (Baizongia pistaciae)]